MSFNPSEARVPKGQPGGGRWGAARDSKAAEAQKNVGAQHHYKQIRSLPSKQRPQYVKNMSDADLEALTAMLYSYRTSDPDVVNARIAVANEMHKRGLDITKYGALGGRVQAVQKQRAAHTAARRVATKTKTAAKPAAAAPAPKPAAHAPGKRAI